MSDYGIITSEMNTQSTAAARIMFFNVGYCTGLDGGAVDYLLRFWRYMYTSRSTLASVLEGIETLLDTEKPDVCCFLEIHKKTGLVDRLEAYPYGDIANKYGLHGILRKFPFFRDNCNAVVAKTKMALHKHYFHTRGKKLIYEVEMPGGASLFVSHLSLFRRTRRKQIKQLIALIKRRKRVMLCGDFNTFYGRDELSLLIEQCGLRIVNPPREGTFPSRNPRMALDLFLCSPDVDVERVRVLKQVQLSDHLPVVVDVRL